MIGSRDAPFSFIYGNKDKQFLAIYNKVYNIILGGNKMKRLLEVKNTAGINPTQIIDKDGNVIKDYVTTIKEGGSNVWDHLDNMLKDGPAWDRLDEMLGE